MATKAIDEALKDVNGARETANELKGLSDVTLSVGTKIFNLKKAVINAASSAPEAFKDVLKPFIDEVGNLKASYDSAVDGSRTYAGKIENKIKDLQDTVQTYLLRETTTPEQRKKLVNSMTNTAGKLESDGVAIAQKFGDWNTALDKFVADWVSHVPSKVGEISSKYASEVAATATKLYTLQTQIQKKVYDLVEDGTSTIVGSNAALVAGSPVKGITLVHDALQEAGEEPELLDLTKQFIELHTQADAKSQPLKSLGAFYESIYKVQEAIVDLESTHNSLPIKAASLSAGPWVLVHDYKRMLPIVGETADDIKEFFESVKASYDTYKAALKAYQTTVV